MTTSTDKPRKPARPWTAPTESAYLAAAGMSRERDHLMSLLEKAAYRFGEMDGAEAKLIAKLYKVAARTLNEIEHCDFQAAASDNDGANDENPAE